MCLGVVDIHTHSHRSKPIHVHTEEGERVTELTARGDQSEPIAGRRNGKRMEDQNGGAKKKGSNGSRIPKFYEGEARTI